MKMLMRMAIVLLTLPWLGGCVFWQIRDNIEATNAQLADVKTTLAAVNSSLDGVNKRLDAVDTGLLRLDTTNTSLGSVEERLILLRSIDASMNRLDVHLASLRKTINRLDGAIPFLDLGGDEPVEEPAPAAATEVVAAATPAPDAKPAAPGDKADEQPKAAAPAPPKRDALVGTWISAYPSTARALILQPDNTFVLSMTQPTGSATRQAGSWSRDKMTMKLTPDAPATPPSPKAPVITGTLPTGGETWQILSYSAKSITVEGPGGLAVFARP